MTGFGDLLGEMRLLPTSEDTADRILAGAVDPEDAPPELRETARVLRAAAAPASATEVAGERVIVPAMAAIVRARRGKVAAARRPARRVALLAAALLVATGGIAAAVGVGSLPEEASDFASQTAKDRLEELGTQPTVDEALADVASAATGKEISELATTTDAEGVDKGAEIASVASHGASEVGTDVAVDAVAGQLPEAADVANDASGGAAGAGTAP